VPSAQSILDLAHARNEFFSCIGLGATSAGIVFVVLLAAFKGSIIDNIARLEWVWRLLLGLGMIPAAFTLHARLTLIEPSHTRNTSPRRPVLQLVVVAGSKTSSETFVSTSQNRNRQKSYLEPAHVGFFSESVRIFRRTSLLIHMQ
jgi:hypothetical protein